MQKSLRGGFFQILLCFQGLLFALIVCFRGFCSGGTIRKHHWRGKISDELRQEALYLAGSYRDKALIDNDYATDGYARDMELEHIYAEAEKRLK